MSSILKRFARREPEPYAFPNAADIQMEEQPAAPPEPGEQSPEREEEKAPPAPDPKSPVDFALLEAEMLVADARKQAEDILEQARRDARREAEEVFEQARMEGSQAGYVDGMDRAMQESKAQREAQAQQLEAEVQQFLDRASATLDDLMDRSADDLRDLTIAIAEKVVRVSLKSSGEVIGRMIQAAIDKRKRREWAHIYIADCDARRMTQLNPSLSAALSALSGRVRIIPMADDESGTCIVETPDEIVDASASTQLTNIKNLLMDTPPGEETLDFRLMR